MRKIISSLLVFSSIFSIAKVSALAKGNMKFRASENIPALSNSTGTGFEIAKKSLIKFSSTQAVGRSTGSVFMRGDQSFTADGQTAIPYLSFKLPPVKKKKKKGSKSRGANVTSSKSKTTRTIGLAFYDSNLKRVSQEKVYSVKRFKKRRTAKRGLFAGVFKDGRQALGRFRIKTNNK
jgi:hypothetical protein